MIKRFTVLAFIVLYASSRVSANLISATPGNYTTFLSGLVPGDTLMLAPGNYLGNLPLNNLNGTALQPIVIMGSGNTTNFIGQSCCNTIGITKCSYLVISNLQLDGNNEAVDAVKGEGTAGNFAHHITIEYLNIINYGSDQQNVGISTKCSAWDWTIRKNKIIGAGTGLYLGNSNGNQPFVNGIIEYNYIANTIGYNMEIKHQLDGVRDSFPGTSVNAKTIIRYNVFTKDITSSTGGSARPNLLVGGFPTTGWGADDYYEIYGNLFYNNPVEALFQGTGNVMMYENIFVNHYDPPGFRAVYFTPHNGISPQNVKVFHNTIWTKNSSGGLRLNSPNGSFQQYCYGNAVFAPSPVTNFTNAVDNITDSYANAGNHVLSASTNITTLNLYPLGGQLTGTLTPSALFDTLTDWDKDFNDDTYDWTFRGAYSGCCTNNGWQLALDTLTHITTGISLININVDEMSVYPNPTEGVLYIDLYKKERSLIEIYNLLGEKVYSSTDIKTQISVDMKDMPVGVYFLRVTNAEGMGTRRIVKR